MTTRARTLALLGLLGLLLGALRGQHLLSLVSLSIVVWIFVQGLRFQISLARELPRVRFERTINARSDSTGTLWCDRIVTIEIRATSPRPLNWTIYLRDIAPEIVEVQPAAPQSLALRTLQDTSSSFDKEGDAGLANGASGPAPMVGSIESWWTKTLPRFESWWAPRRKSDEAVQAVDIHAGLGETAMPPRLRSRWPKLRSVGHVEARADPNVSAVESRYQQRFERGMRSLIFAYAVRPLAAGQVTFPGLRLTVCDDYGLFVHPIFHPLAQSYRILPRYYQSAELRPTVKRQNSLPRHGIHRLQRAGMGSELLELREYVAGDPPKSIAWKVSARRDRLLTRQYESEVPVRVHLMIDGSASTRMGGYGRRLIDQVFYVAASVAQAAMAVGDPVSGLLIDQDSTQRLPWYSGDRGQMELLKSLSEFSLRAPPTTRIVTPYMLQCAIAICQERTPELLDKRCNWIPWSLSAATRQRYRLCGALAEVFQLSPYQQVECMHDDACLSVHLQKLLWQAGMPWMAPIVPDNGDPNKEAQRRLQVIRDALLRAIAHAHDNEVFVIFVDLLSCAANLTPLKQAVKLAIAKHHRVALVVPTTTFLRPKSEQIIPTSDSIEDLLLAAEKTRVRDLAYDLKRELVRVGAAVSFTGEQSAIQMVIAEMDRACDGRTSSPSLRTARS